MHFVHFEYYIKTLKITSIYRVGRHLFQLSHIHTNRPKRYIFFTRHVFKKKRKNTLRNGLQEGAHFIEKTHMYFCKDAFKRHIHKWAPRNCCGFY